MARTHLATPTEIILSRAKRAGMDPVDLARRIGMPKSTFDRRRKKESWSLVDLLMIDDAVHLSGDDITDLRKWWSVKGHV